MAKLTEEDKSLELLEHIRRLLMLSLSHTGVEGKRIAGVLGIDPASVSRILSGKKVK